MKKLRMNVSQMNGARSSLKSTASTFSSQIKNQDLFSKYNCNEASVSSIIKNYISNVKSDLSEISSKLDKYVDVVGKAISILENADNKVLSPMLSNDISDPTALSLLADNNLDILDTEIPDSDLWYAYLHLPNTFKKAGDLILGGLSNFVVDGNPQGFEEIGRYLVGTNSNGTLYIYDKDTKETKKIDLGDYHLGGIAHNNGYLYVATGDTTTRYNFDELLSGNLSSATSFDSRTTENNPTSSAVSFITSTDDGRVITGQFKADNDKYRRGGLASDLIVYNVDNNGNMVETSTIKIPKSMNQIQGMCVYNVNGVDYYLLTSSYGKSNSKNSTLYVTTLSEDGSELVQRGSYKLPSGAEQVTVTSDNNIAVTYEGDVSRGYITVLDGEKLIDV